MNAPSPNHPCPPQSEVVVPVLTGEGRLLAVLDVDSGALPPPCPLLHQPRGSCARPANGHQHMLVLLLSPLGMARVFCSPPHADLPAAFTETDAEWLERLCSSLGARTWQTGL